MVLVLEKNASISGQWIELLYVLPWDSMSPFSDYKFSDVPILPLGDISLWGQEGNQGEQLYFLLFYLLIFQETFFWKKEVWEP